METSSLVENIKLIKSNIAKAQYVRDQYNKYIKNRKNTKNDNTYIYNR